MHEDTEQINVKKKLSLGILILNHQKPKIKKFLKEASGKIITCRGTEVRITFSFVRNNASKKRVEWNSLNVLRRKTHLPRILCPAKLFKSEGEIMTLKQKLMEFIASLSALQEMLKKSSLREEK